MAGEWLAWCRGGRWKCSKEKFVFMSFKSGFVALMPRWHWAVLFHLMSNASTARGVDEPLRRPNNWTIELLQLNLACPLLVLIAPSPSAPTPPRSFLCVCPLYHPSSLEKVQQHSGQFIHRHERGHICLTACLWVWVWVCVDVQTINPIFGESPLTPTPTPPLPWRQSISALPRFFTEWQLVVAMATDTPPTLHPHPSHSPPFLRGKRIEMSLLLGYKKHTCALLCDDAVRPGRAVIRDDAFLKTHTCAHCAQTGTLCIECLQAVSKELQPYFLFLLDTSCQTCWNSYELYKLNCRSSVEYLA